VSETDPTQGTDPAKEALVTIDAGAPTSTVASLPSQTTTPSFTVSWSGSDDAGGSGIATFDVFVQTDGGTFTPFLTGTTAVSATFNGAVGHTYGFYSVATDNVGHRQATPASAQASTTVVMSSQLIVSSNADSGPGTLRQALLDANAAPGSPHTIQFQLPAGSQSITLLTPLPTATNPLTLSLDATQNVTVALPAGANWTDDHALTVSGAGSFTAAGGIDGAGDLTVGAGGSLTATHIVQNALIIGGSSSSPAIVTISPSDAAGDPLFAIDAGAASAARRSASFAQPLVSTAMPAGATLETPSAAVVAPSEGAQSPGQQNVAGQQRSSTMPVSPMVTQLPSDVLCPSASAPALAVNSSPARSEALDRPVAARSTATSRQLDPEAVAVLMDDFGAFEWSGADGGRREATSGWDDALGSDEPTAALLALMQF
jgi:hypothetical protein